MVPLLGLVPRLWVGLPSCVELSEARRFVWPASCISHEGNREASVSDRGWCRSLAFGNKLDLLLASNGSASTDPWSRGSTGRLTKAHNSRSALSHHPLVMLPGCTTRRWQSRTSQPRPPSVDLSIWFIH